MEMRHFQECCLHKAIGLSISAVWQHVLGSFHQLDRGERPLMEELNGVKLRPTETKLRCRQGCSEDDDLPPTMLAPFWRCFFLMVR